MRKIFQWLNREKQKEGGTPGKPQTGEGSKEKETRSVGLKVLKVEILLVALLPGMLLVMVGLWMLGLVTGINLTLGDLVKGLMTFLRIPGNLRKKREQKQETKSP